MTIERAEVKDEVCYRPPGHCTLCSINDPVHTATVRGLCHETIFDTEYYYNIDESGDIMFLGKEESMIKFDSRKQRWIWTDRNYQDNFGKNFQLKYFNNFTP